MHAPRTGCRPWRRIATAALVFSAFAAGACQPAGTAAPTAMPPAGSLSPAGSPGPAACLAADLVVSGGEWGAAAGSRGALVGVGNQGVTACTLTATAQVAIVDDTSAPIVQSDPSAEDGPTLQPNDFIQFTVLLGNWCDETAILPLHVVLRAADAGVNVAGLDIGASDLPPCNGPDQPPVLTVQPWEES